MKKVLLSALSLTVLVTSLVFSAEKSAITLAPLGLLYGRMCLNYEHALSNKTAIQPRLDYYSFDLSSVKYSWTGLGCTYKMYPKGEALRNFFWGPRADILMVNFEADDLSLNTRAKASSTWLGVGIEIGQRWVYESGFCLEIGANAEMITSSKITVGSYEASYSGFQFSPSFNLGFIF